MTEKPPAQKGRPVTNRIDQIPSSPQDIAKAMFAANDKKLKKPKPKPN